MKSKGRGVLDAPLEPVIGLAEGETRWRGMTNQPAGRVSPTGPRKARPVDRLRRNPPPCR